MQLTTKYLEEKLKPFGCLIELSDSKKAIIRKDFLAINGNIQINEKTAKKLENLIMPSDTHACLERVEQGDPRLFPILNNPGQFMTDSESLGIGLNDYGYCKHVVNDIFQGILAYIDFRALTQKEYSKYLAKINKAIEDTSLDEVTLDSIADLHSSTSDFNNFLHKEFALRSSPKIRKAKSLLENIDTHEHSDFNKLVLAYAGMLGGFDSKLYSLTLNLMFDRFDELNKISVIDALKLLLLSNENEPEIAAKSAASPHDEDDDADMIKSLCARARKESDIYLDLVSKYRIQSRETKPIPCQNMLIPVCNQIQNGQTDYDLFETAITGGDTALLVDDSKKRLKYFVHEDLLRYGFSKENISKLLESLSKSKLYRMIKRNEVTPLKFRNILDDVVLKYLAANKIPSEQDLEQVYRNT